jgi:hypothetical protein
MIYKVISEWVTEKISLLNNSLPPEERIKPADVNFDMDLLPANLKDNSYLIKLSKIKNEDNESGEMTVNTVIEFHFRLYKKPLLFYRKLIDEKLFALCRILVDDEAGGLEYISDGLTIANIHSVAVTGLDKAYKGGEYIFPRVEFELQIFIN